MEPRKPRPKVIPSPFIPLFQLLAKQSGVGLIFAVVCGYGMVGLYSDLRETNRVMLDLVRQQVDASRSVSDSLNSLSIRIEAHEQRMRNEKKP